MPVPSYAFPTPPATITPTPLDELDRAIARVRKSRHRWAELDIEARITLLDRLLGTVAASADAWVDLALRAKGLAADQPAAGEEWLGGPVVTLRNIRLLKQALRDIKHHGRPQIAPERLSYRADGRLVAEVFPDTHFDKAMFPGFRAEVWMRRGVTADNLESHQASAYRRNIAGRVAAVLGAGNVSSIPAMDTLYKLFADKQVVVLKMNPVNEYLGPVLERALAPLVEQDLLAIVYGGPEQGAHLCNHPDVDTLHLTGSDATHDAIVWGPAEGRQDRKKRGERANDKPITSELGNVTPLIVVPGAWSDADLAFQAENVASMVANNASFNCNAAKLLVTSRDWPQRAAFLDAVRAVLRSLPNRKAYYPGARARWSQFVDAHPEAELLTADAPDTVPWTLISDLDPSATDDICFRTEPFCAVLHEVALPGEDAAAFLPEAVAFCNRTVWGTLSCSILVHPSSRKDVAVETALQEALDRLRYGSIGINHWAGLVYGLAAPPWGAYPGHTAADIQSGAGVVHNTALFDRPEKSVVSGPFRVFPKPPWFVTHRRTHRVGQSLAAFEARPSLGRLSRVGYQALRG